MLERFLPLLVTVASSFAFSHQAHAMPQRVDFQMRTLNATGETIEICDPELVGCEMVLPGSKKHDNYLSSELPNGPLAFILSRRVVKVCKLVIPMAKMIDVPVLSQQNNKSIYFLTISRTTYLRECGSKVSNLPGAVMTTPTLHAAARPTTASRSADRASSDEKTVPNTAPGTSAP